MTNLSKSKRGLLVWGVVSLFLLLGCAGSQTEQQLATIEVPTPSTTPTLTSTPTVTVTPIPTSVHIRIVDPSPRPLLSRPAHDAVPQEAETKPDQTYVVLRGPVALSDTVWYEIEELQGGTKGWIEGDFLNVIPPTPTLTPTATRPPTPSVVIADVQNSRAEEQGKALNDERVILVNFGQAIDLLGWSLANSGSETYTFGEVVLEQRKGIILHSGQGVDNSTDMFWGRSTEAWNNDGDVIILRDSAGREVDRFSY